MRQSQLRCLKSRLKGSVSRQLILEQKEAFLVTMELPIYFLPFNLFLLNASVCHHCFAIQRLLEKVYQLLPSLTGRVHAKQSSQLSPGSTSP